MNELSEGQHSTLLFSCICNGVHYLTGTFISTLPLQLFCKCHLLIFCMGKLGYWHLLCLPLYYIYYFAQESYLVTYHLLVNLIKEKLCKISPERATRDKILRKDWGIREARVRIRNVQPQLPFPYSVCYLLPILWVSYFNFSVILNLGIPNFLNAEKYFNAMKLFYSTWEKDRYFLL